MIVWTVRCKKKLVALWLDEDSMGLGKYDIYKNIGRSIKDGQ